MSWMKVYIFTDTMHAVHLQCPIQGDALQAVDLGVIRARTNVRSETTQTDEDFRTKLLERDVSCVWTGVGEDLGNGLHIIPYRRGSDVRA